MKTETLTIKAPKLSPSHRIRVGNETSDSLRIKNVLVPLDFSQTSHSALRSVLPLLERFGANLHLVHVLPLDSPFARLADLPMVVPGVEIRRRVRRDLGKAAKNYAIETESAHLQMRRGTAFAEICSLASENAIDLIVIATRGISGLKHVLLGSTAERVVRHSPCPVLVVRDRGKDRKPNRNGSIKGRQATIKRILVPIDFSDYSAGNLACAKQLAKEFNATLVLLHSIAIPYFVTSDEYARYDFPLLMQQSEKYAKTQMRTLVAKMIRDGVRAEPSLQIGHAGQEICACAEAEKADLIVTSTHGWTGLKHVLIGSTAEYVVRHSSVPVLVVPSHERPIPT